VVQKKYRIISIGEILWDAMPSGLFLGGAPYNVAYHLARLGKEVGLISRVGKDDLGTEAIKRATLHGISTDLIQFDDYLNTGFVEVTLRNNGTPDYTIKRPVAWDEITLNEHMVDSIQLADAVIFGTLAQRSETSKKSIQQLATVNCLRVLDLNLRFPFVDRNVVEDSLKMADILKINEDELEMLQSWFQLSNDPKKSLKTLAVMFSLELVCVTRGGNGAMLWGNGEWLASKGYNVEVADTVGAGDAFLASIVSGYLEKVPAQKLLEYSNRLGAYVAGCNGGTPLYSVQSLSDIVSLPLKKVERNSNY